jgi:hypothetical protein
MRNAIVTLNTILTEVDSESASVEGLDIVDVDRRGFFEIQKIDDVELFDSDEEAVNFVRSQAFASVSRFYRAALTIHDWYAAHIERPVP